MPNVMAILQERGLIEAITHEDLHEVTKKPIKVYCGFDPTSDSLHLGNMVAMMGLAWFQRCGHTPIAIVGGATGLIGDPSGKNAERQLLDETTLQKNLNGIRQNLLSFLDFNQATNKAYLLNNFDWFKDFSFMNFLREVGKYFRIGTMINKESVKTRLQSEEGLSFTEFSYQVLQAYDFLYLFKNHGVTVQIGGSDQWGNITAGTELIRKVEGQVTYGITLPLMTRSDGQKFGKSEKGALWLAPDKLSPYDLYQYLFRITDADVIKLMRMLTFMDMEEIARYEKMLKQTDSPPNTAQKRLAEEITTIIHGQKELLIAQRITVGAAPGAKTELTLQALEELEREMTSLTFSSQEILGLKLIDLLTDRKLQASKGEAKRLMRNGGIYVNNVKITDENFIINLEHLIESKFLLLSIGKKNKIILKINF